MNIGNIAEQRVVKRLRNGENGAMEEFYSKYAPYLKGVCSRYISDKEDVKDVFQNALVRILTHTKEFKYHGQSSLRVWATRIVINEALRFLNSTKRHELTTWDDDMMNEVEEDDPPVEDIPPEVIQQMVRQLPTGYRTVFNLYAIEGYSHKEIAETLGLSEGGCRSQLSRARVWLQERLKKIK